MSEPIDDLLFPPDWSEDRIAALRARYARDPALARALVRWQQLRRSVRGRLESSMPDRSVLVLYALETAGRGDLLSDEERAVLAAAKPDIERALESHPGLTDAATQIRRDAADFIELWRSRVGEGRPVDRPPIRRRSGAFRWTARLAVAAAVVAFVAVAVLLVQRDRSMMTMETGPGETRVIELGDGTSVRLLGSSVISYPRPSGGVVFSRTARLEGRAFFDVPWKDRGFVLMTPTARATVMGTRFGVDAGPGMTEVVLVDGRLTLAPHAAPSEVVVLEPGEMSRVAENALPTTPVDVNLSTALAWLDQFIFEALPARDIADQLAEHFHVPVEVDPTLADEPVTGTFEKNQPLAEILAVIAAALDARVEPYQEDGYRLLARRPATGAGPTPPAEEAAVR